MDEVRRKHKFYRERGIGSQVIDEKALCEAEPNLRSGLAGGLLVESDSVVYQLTATRFLINNAAKNGCVTRFGQRVADITSSGVRLANGDDVAAAIVINAAGVDAPKLSPEIKIIKRKGHLVISDRYPSFAHHQLVELGYLKSAHGSDADSVAFNLQPRATGQMLLGSSRQFAVEDLAVDHEILARMTSRAFEYMPSLRQLSAIRVWTGFRPSTPDNLPYIGPSPAQKNTFIAAGHEGLGITTALGTAELITCMVTGREPAIPVEPFSPSRRIESY
jgi:glycine/D-amino acid oxidase-like deaminating enzyme